MLKPLTCESEQTLKNSQEMGISDHHTYLLRNLFAGQEATVRTRHETTNCFNIGKRVCQACILSPCIFTLYAESVQFSHSVVSDSSWPHEPQHVRPPCPSPPPRVYPRVHHAKCVDGWITSWNQDCQKKYQQTQICKWCYSNGRKLRTKEPLDKGERGEWKSWFKTQHLKN